MLVNGKGFYLPLATCHFLNDQKPFCLQTEKNFTGASAPVTLMVATPLKEIVSSLCVGMAGQRS